MQITARREYEVQQVLAPSSATWLSWGSTRSREISGNSLIASNYEYTVESQYICDEKGRRLRDRERIHERWVKFFLSLLNEKSHLLDPDIS